ncbi:GerAB/ArcD/ProY family transporter [Zongyangia hominis]|uniref:GerAB/ArcD/ProY family transporter n=1 Tax=Zongyangia hominis TaxID=2763677 RepID=A0A926ED15_9FIRM|nr:spore germination protein [Zongyangia hominis]MBC8569517.1 GerAB/ArcD/ProY family transporter [Zongyangia hominis]
MAKRQVKMYQVVLLLFLSRTFTIISYNPKQGTSFGATTTILGMVAGFVLVFLLFLPGYALIRRNSLPGEAPDLSMCAAKALGKGSAVVDVIYFLFFAGVAGYTVANFELFITTAVYPHASQFLIVFLLILAACYGVYMGVESLSRISIVVFGFFFISMAFIFVALVPDIDWVNLKMPFWSGLEQGMTAFWGGVMDSVGRSVELAAVLYLAPHIIGDLKKGVLAWDAMFTVKFILVSVLIVGVLGQLGITQPFPFYTLTSMAEISIFQRLDSLHVSIWVLMGYVKTALFLFLSAKSLSHMVPEKFRRHTPWVATAVALGFALLLSDNVRNLNLASLANGTGLPVLIAVFLIPGVLWLIDVIRHRKPKGEEANAQ